MEARERISSALQDRRIVNPDDCARKDHPVACLQSDSAVQRWLPRRCRRASVPGGGRWGTGAH
jgi:hypothetical protein